MVRGVRNGSPREGVDVLICLGLALLFYVLMFLGCWNIRGLNDPIKQAEVRRFLRDEKLSLCGLVETKVKEVNFVNVSRAIHPSWKFLAILTLARLVLSGFVGTLVTLMLALFTLQLKLFIVV